MRGRSLASARNTWEAPAAMSRPASAPATARIKTSVNQLGGNRSSGSGLFAAADRVSIEVEIMASVVGPEICGVDGLVRSHQEFPRLERAAFHVIEHHVARSCEWRARGEAGGAHTRQPPQALAELAEEHRPLSR